MEELQKEAIMKNITYVVDNMNRQPIMDCLVESSVFTMTDVATVNAIGLIDEDKNRELIKILFRKGEDLKPYEHFIRALEKKHQKAIAAKIKNTHEELLHLPSAEASTTTTQPTAAASVPGTSGTDGNGKSVNREETTNDNIPTDGEDNVNRQTVVVEEKPSKRNRFCSAFLKWKYLLAIGSFLGLALIGLIIGIVVIVLMNQDDDVSKAAKCLKDFYQPKLFGNDYSLNSFSTTDIDKIWIDPTLEYDGKTDTEYQTLVNETFLEKNILLIEGDGGTGKSFLLRKIMRDWISGRLPQFKLAIYFEFRYIQESKTTIVDLVHGAIGSLFDSSASLIKGAIDELINTSGSQDILVIMDGYDEVYPSICEQLKKLLSPDTGILPETHFKIIISARTNYIQVNNKGRFGHAKILGFVSWPQKTKFISKYFSLGNNTVDARSLKTRLNSTTFLMEWSTNPLYLTFICAVFKQLKKSTELELYEKIVIHHMKVYGKKSSNFAINVFKKCDFNSEDNVFEIKAVTEDQWRKCLYLHKLGNLAFKKLFDSRGEVLKFSKADLLDFQISSENVSDFGFLMKEDLNHEFVYKFRHKSFQEFFAAFYCNTFDSFSNNDSIKWHDYLSVNIANKPSGNKHYHPTEFEYFLFRYAVANFERGKAAMDQMRPLLRKYTALDFSFSKADIKSEQQLAQFLAELINVSHLSLSGTLQIGSVRIPEMENLRVLIFNSINFIHENQTILPLPKGNLLNLTTLSYRTCPRSTVEWQMTIRSISRSWRNLTRLELHCSFWPETDFNFLLDFIKESVNCSKRVKKLSIFKDLDVNWPSYDKDDTKSSMTDALLYILMNSDFASVEFNKHFHEFYKIGIKEFPSMESRHKKMEDKYNINVAVHRANSTLFLDLFEWNIKTEEQLSTELEEKYANLTRLIIFGTLEKGNIRLPKLNRLRSLEFGSIQFSNPSYQSILMPSRKHTPKLKKIVFRNCTWSSPNKITQNQWRNTVNSLSNSSLELDSLQFFCLKWWETPEWFFHILANSTIKIKKLQLFKNDDNNDIMKSEAEVSANFDIIEALKQVAKSKNIYSIVLNQEFVRSFKIDMTKFISYNTSGHGKRLTYTITCEPNTNDEAISFKNTTEIREPDPLAGESEDLQGIVWRFIRFFNYTHITIKAELKYCGHVIHEIISVEKIAIRNGNVFSNITASLFQSHLHSGQSDETFAVYSCCSSLNDRQSRDAMDLYCEDQRPLLTLNFTSFNCSNEGHNIRLLIDHLTKLFRCKSAFDTNNVYFIDLQDFKRTDIFYDQSQNASGKLEPASDSSITITVELHDLTHKTNSIHPLIKQLFGYQIAAKIIAVKKNETDIRDIEATGLYLDLTQCHINTGEQLSFYLAKFPKLINLTISGNLLKGTLHLPPLSSLETVKFLNLMFSEQEQKIDLSGSHYPSLKNIYYESCPWAWDEVKNLTIAEATFFSPNIASLHSLCSSLPSLSTLVVHCSDWSSKSWPFLANFFAGIENCTSIIHSLYLLKHPLDQWYSLDEKRSNISMAIIIKTLIEKENLLKIIVNDGFLSSNDTNIAHMPKAIQEHYLGMNVYVYKRDEKDILNESSILNISDPNFIGTNQKEKTAIPPR